MMSEEVIVLSSEDECEIIQPNTENVSKESFEQAANIFQSDIFDSIQRRMLSPCIGSSSDDDEVASIESIELIINSIMNHDLENIVLPKSKKAKTTNDDRILNKFEKEQEKAKKQVERERIKAENAKIKAEKQRLAAAYKNLLPEESIKLITVLIDAGLMEMECSTNIITSLHDSKISYRISPNAIPSTIIWSKTNQLLLPDILEKLQINKPESSDEALLIMLWPEFIKLVHEHELTANVKSRQEMLNKKVHLGIYGLENYFRFHKHRKQRVPAKEKIFAEAPKVTRKEADMALIEIQLLFQISHRFLETPEDLSTMIVQFTKSISQIPYKLHQNQKTNELDWYVAGDKKDSVKVNKTGHGLHRLWQQQLTQLNLVKFETAEAISSKYSSPTALIKAYDECATLEDGEKLLQDIPIRRAVGPLTSARKIGPELSKKLFTLFTSTDGDMDL